MRCLSATALIWVELDSVPRQCLCPGRAQGPMTLPGSPAHAISLNAAATAFTPANGA